MCKLRDIRRDQLLSGHDLAALVGVTPGAIYNVETGYSRGGWKLRRKISRALGVSERAIWPESGEDAATGALT